MIYLDSLRPLKATWRGGVACHMVSDESLQELRGFAQSLGLDPWRWLEGGAGPNPHFLCSPPCRIRALRAGAIATDREGIYQAQRRRRAAERAAGIAAVEAARAAAAAHGVRRA